MKYKTLYAAHEARMWLGTIIAGAGVVATIVTTNPEIKERVSGTYNRIKNKFRRKPKIKKIKLVVVEPEEEGS